MMKGNLFGGLGGALGDLVGGLAKSGLVPQDDPAVKLFHAQTERADLQKQEAEIFTEIGRQAFAQNPDGWPQADKLRLIHANMADAEGRIAALTQAQEEVETGRFCGACGVKNEAGTNFCRECGAKL